MAGTAVTLDMEDHTTTDSTLEILRTLRKEYPKDRRRVAGIPVPDRVRLPGSSRRRIARSALQGRVRGAGERGIPRSTRDRQVLRTLHEDLDGGQRFPNAGHS